MVRAKKEEAPRFPEFRDAFLELMGEMTLQEFADKLGMSRATVGFYAAGQRIPDALGIKAIAQKCNVSSDWLLGLTAVRSVDGDVQQTCGTTGLSEIAVSRIIETDNVREYNFLLEHGYVETIARYIYLYKEHLFAMYLEDFKSEMKKKAAEEKGNGFIDLKWERMRNDAERRGYKADLIECVLSITQKIDAEYHKTYSHAEDTE